MSPLVKRLPREFRHNIGKYLGVFLLMFGSIALTSGFLLAARSITVIMDGMRDEYRVEDARFTTGFEATTAQLDAAERATGPVGGADIYPNFSIDAELTLCEEGRDGVNSASAGKDLTLRAYAHREQVDLAALAEGEFPASANEVAVDRVFAANAGIRVGDRVGLCGRAYTVSGIVTLPDSTALFSSNSDFTVNTVTFGVAELTQEGFDALREAGGSVAYTYSLVFRDRDLTLAQRTDAEKDLARALSDANASLTDLLDRDSNQGISYAASDVEGDSAMWSTLLYMIIVMMAFIFIVLTSATIEDESAVIGTLLASGYRRRELVLHYLALPTLVGLMAALAGTAAGVAWMTAPMSDLYYSSYSLPPYHTYWDWSIVFTCAVVPFLVLVAVTLVGTLAKMGHTPLQFLRHEASRRKKGRGLELPDRLGFQARFRLRVFARNLGNFATLFIGMAFASMLMLFAFAVLPTMTHYGDSLKESVVAAHEYSLKAPLELEGTDADREAWAAAGTLADADPALLDEASRAADELEEKASELEAAMAELQASPTPAAAARAQQAADSAQDARDALYQKVDAVAAGLGKTRGDVLDLVQKASTIDADDEDAHPVNSADNGAARIAQAEKYTVYQLEYERPSGSGTESVTTYGVQGDSAYWKGLDVADLNEGEVIVGAGLAQKYGISVGDRISLYDKYEDKTYGLTVAGTWGAKTDTGAYLRLDGLNALRGKKTGYFNGYASNEPLDLDARYLASDLTPSDMQAIGDQFVDMMGPMVGLLGGLAAFIFFVFMYLLTKSIIDRSARSISYMKVFGYRDREVSRLYVRSITWVTAVSLVVCQPLLIEGLTAVFVAMLYDYSGNIQIYVPLAAVAQTVAIGLATYAVVALIHMRSIRRVPLSIALKAQE